MGVQWFAPDGSVLDQLASYTGNSQDTATTTNVSESMPTLANGWRGLMAMNPAGTILAVATGTGTQFFHFNGAEPITPFTGGVIGSSGFITAMAWDNDGHLYALNGATGRLHVYAVTSTTAKEVSGSPYQPPFKSFAYPRIVVHSN
jgi:outer membrane protein assembly factor BamB